MQFRHADSLTPGRLAGHGWPSGRPWSVRMADSALSRYPAGQMRWHYEDGLLLRAIASLTSPGSPTKYWQAAQIFLNRFVEPDGTIRTYRVDEYNLDQIQPGRLLFGAWRATGEERFRRAICVLREQLRWQPRTSEGGFWHKLIYPYQMWLDGIYMAGPFLAQYAAELDELPAFDEVAAQILLIARHTHDPFSGLLYHAWDESREQRWANAETGCSPHFWGRAVGWYLMAIVDVLDFLPASHPQFGNILAGFAATVRAVCDVQDAATGLWYQVLDQGQRAGNYLEASASCMYVYSIAKGLRQGYLGDEYLGAARHGYQGIVTRLVEVDAAGTVSLHGTCGVAGLGGRPYRDGSFEYYVAEPTVTNDLKGVGPFILASLEMERLAGMRPE